MPTDVLYGKRDIIIKVYAAILAGGHILLEDIPGVGKTTLATAFARTLDMKYNRVQFTPDVLQKAVSLSTERVQRSVICSLRMR